MGFWNAWHQQLEQEQQQQQQQEVEKGVLWKRHLERTKEKMEEGGDGWKGEKEGNVHLL